MFDTTKSKDDTRGQGQTRAIGPVNGRVISGDTWPRTQADKVD